MKMHQDTSFCTSSDGTRIAIAACGSGPVILRAAHWLSHVGYDLESPVWRPWIEALSRQHRYIRYDPRGCGMSERHCADLSLDAWHQDLEAVATTMQDQKFALLGISQGGALAINYAVRHPEKVSHLILFNAYAQGGQTRARNDAERLEAETLVNFIRIGWGRENPAFCQFFTNLFIPGGTPQQQRWWGDLERLTATPEVAAETLKQMQRIDVTDRCASVQVPTLVLSCQRDARVPFEQGAMLAAAIPGARFVPLDSANHVLLPSEPAWTVFYHELSRFLGNCGPEARMIAGAGLTEAEAEVFRLLTEGLDNRAIAARLGKSEKTVRNQLSVIFSKQGVTSRAQAIVKALDR